MQIKNKTLDFCKTHYLIIMIILIAFLARLYGCIHEEVYGDSPFILSNTQRLIVKKTFIPISFIYPPFYNYISLIPHFIVGAVCKQLGIISSIQELTLLIDFKPLLALLGLRIISLISGTAAIIMTYKIGNDFFNKNVGIIAALLLTIDSNHLFYSSIAKHEALLTFFVTVIIYFCLKALEENNIKFIYLSSIVAGLATATKYNGACIYMLILICTFILCRQKKILEMIRIMSISAGLYLLCFIVSSPVIILNLDLVQEALKFHYNTSVHGTAHEAISPPYLGYINQIKQIIGIHSLIFILSLPSCLIKPDKKRIALVSTFLFLFLCYGSFGRQYLRYIIFLFPILYITVGILINSIGELFPQKKINKLIIILLASSIALIPIQKSYNRIIAISYLKNNSNHQVLEQLEWIQENIPTSSNLLIYGYPHNYGLIESWKRDYYRNHFRPFYDKYIQDKRIYEIMRIPLNQDFNCGSIPINKFNYFIIPQYDYDKIYSSDALAKENVNFYNNVTGKSPHSTWNLLKEFNSGNGQNIYIYQNINNRLSFNYSQ